MKKIIEYLTDPVLVFSVFILGFLASLLAGYCRGWFSRLLAKISRSYRERKERKDKVTQKRIEKVASDPTLLIIESIRSVRLQILTLATLIAGSAFFVCFIISIGVEHRPLANLFGPLSVFVILLSYYCLFLSASHMRFFRKVYRLYKKNIKP